MSLSKVRLVVTDMDGTLLNSQHNISPLFFKQFKKLIYNDIIFVVASGRPLYGMLDKLETIKNDLIFVAENGGLVIKGNQTLISNPIKKDNLSVIIEALEKANNIHPIFCTRDKAYVMSTSKPLLHLLSEYYSNYKIINSEDEIEEEVYKVAIYHPENSEKHIYPFVKHLEKNFKVKLSAVNWIDISEQVANKGTAIKYLQNKYNISKLETLAFGDYNNDIEMLESAYFSYAMENAHPLVKSVARFRTKSNNNFGVEHILSELLNEKEKAYK
ncbi:HAD family hydrolase [Flavobacteriaceae bacterium MHTCC 0001]